MEETKQRRITNSERLTFGMPPSLKAHLEAEAAATGVTPAELARRGARLYLAAVTHGALAPRITRRRAVRTTADQL